ncbi:hypothetical protein MMC22_009391 [Lobaria immixta]|nr:hypothetical protein [Lobaria immixta]
MTRAGAAVDHKARTRMSNELRAGNAPRQSSTATSESLRIEHSRPIRRGGDLISRFSLEEIEDLQLGEDPLEETSTITRQADYETESLEADPEAEKQAENDDLEWAQHQYPSPDPSVLETF